MLTVWSVACMEPHIIDWFTKRGQVLLEFVQETYHFECDALTY